jgi:hypothetical protein
MSLNWNWDKKVGEVTFTQEIDGVKKDFVSNLYNGNACLIMVYEYTDENDGKEKYQLTGFFADKTHMKRCLGIDKRYKQTLGKNMYEDSWDRLTKIRLNKAKCRDVKDIVMAFYEAFNNITIELYTEE